MIAASEGGTLYGLDVRASEEVMQYDTGTRIHGHLSGRVSVTCNIYDPNISQCLTTTLGVPTKVV